MLSLFIALTGQIFLHLFTFSLNLPNTFKILLFQYSIRVTLDICLGSSWEYVSNDEGAFPKNLQGFTHEECEEQDDLLMGWLMTVIMRVCVCISAKLILDTLAKVFANNSS